MVTLASALPAFRLVTRPVASTAAMVGSLLDHTRSPTVPVGSRLAVSWWVAPLSRSTEVSLIVTDWTFWGSGAD